MIELQDCPTKLLLEAANLPPRFSMEMEHEGDCAMCGLHLARGDKAEWFDAPSTFSDYGKLAFPESPYLCPYCAGAYARAPSPYYRFFTQKFTNHIAIEGKGVFPIGKNLESAYWFLNPPKARWVGVAASTTNQQHIWWMAPINEPSPVGQLMFGHSRMVIRFPVLKQAHRLSYAYRETYGAAPFVVSRDLSNPTAGAIRENERKPAESVSFRDPELFAVLQSLTRGEVWALNRVAFISPEQIERFDPEPVNFKSISSKGAKNVNA